MLAVLMVVLLVGCGGVPQATQAELDSLRQEKATWQADGAELSQLQVGQVIWQKDQIELNQLRGEKSTWQEQQGQIDEQANQIKEFKNEIAKNLDQIAERNQKIGEQNLQLAEIERENTELVSQNAELEKAIESLREPLPSPQEEVVTTIVRARFLVLLRNYYPNAAIHYGPLEVPLVSREFMEEFLAADRTDFLPGCREINKDLCDHLAFRLKDRWVRAGHPPYALGLLKGERPFPGGLHWRNIFIVMEGERLVIYEIIPKYDRLVKIEKPNPNTYRILFSNRDPI